MSEVGPYVYRETWHKTNITFDDDSDLVSYDLVKVFEHLPDLSDGDADEDAVVFPNIPLFSAGKIMLGANVFTRMGFEATLSGLAGNESLNLFHRKKAGDLIWGYDEPLVSLASMVK